MEYRSATFADTEAIAALHAESWRLHYRGSYPDAFLDGEVGSERLAEWTARLSRPAPEDRTTVAVDEDGRLAGLVHTILHEDPEWGALLDNLHVRPDVKRQGIGARLLACSAEAVLVDDPSSALHLWVLEKNTAAQAFYAAQGGIARDREAFETQGGGHAVGIRIVWPNPIVLLRVP